MISRPKRISIDDFEHMVAQGDFEKTRERIDLIRGALRVMSPAGPEHEDVLTCLQEWSHHWAPQYGFRVRSEKSIKFANLDSIPEPDIVWVKQRRYLRQRPTAADVVLVIEVACSSLHDDRREMASLYAEAGIPEYWIANCIDQQIEVYREPSSGEYRKLFIVGRGEKAVPLAAPVAELDVTELFADE